MVLKLQQQQTETPYSNPTTSPAWTTHVNQTHTHKRHNRSHLREVPVFSSRGWRCLRELVRRRRGIKSFLVSSWELCPWIRSIEEQYTTPLAEQLKYSHQFRFSYSWKVHLNGFTLFKISRSLSMFLFSSTELSALLCSLLYALLILWVP